MTSFRLPIAFAALMLAALTLAGPAAAQKAGDGRAPILGKLADCRKIADNGQRLACFDAVAAEMDVAEKKGDIVVVDREQARTVRRQAFGFHMPSITLFEKGEKAEEVDSLTGTVKAARMTGAGKWVIELEDGAVWAQIDATEVPFPPKSGDPVRIKKASMGSFLMIVKNQRAFRARRQE